MQRGHVIVLGLLVIAIVIVVVAVARRRGRTPLSVVVPEPRSPGEAPSRSPLSDKLTEWVGVALITEAQADAIEAHERRLADRQPNRLPLAAEGVGYIGAGLLFTASAMAIGQRWDDLGAAGRIALLAAPTLVAALIGWWVGTKPAASLQRLASVLWLLAGGGIAATATEVWIDALHHGTPPDRGGVLFVGAVTAAATIPAWWWRREPLQQLAMFASAVTVVVGLVDTFTSGAGHDLSAAWVGIGLSVLAAGWLALGLAGRLPPRLLAVLLGAGLAITSPQFLRVDHPAFGLWLGLVGSLILLAIGVTRAEVTCLLIGTVGLFQWIPQLALHYLSDTLGAEAALAVVGTLLLVVAGTMSRIYPWVRRHRRPPPPDEADPSPKDGPPVSLTGPGPGGGGRRTGRISSVW